MASRLPRTHKESGIAPVDLALLATSDIIASLMNAHHEETANLTRGLDAVNALRDYLLAVRNTRSLGAPRMRLLGTLNVEEAQLEWDEDGLHLRLFTTEDDVHRYRVANPEQLLKQAESQIGSWLAGA